MLEAQQIINLFRQKATKQLKNCPSEEKQISDGGV